MKSQTVNLPVVSVIMPVRNEAKFIESSLSAVLAQDYPSHLLEILVVDGLSNDGTRAVVQSFIERRRESSLAHAVNNAPSPSPSNAPALLYSVTQPLSARPSASNVVVSQPNSKATVTELSDNRKKVASQGPNGNHANAPTEQDNNNRPPKANTISPIYLLDNPKKIVPTALNVAIRRANGAVVIIVGGHAMIESDYVRKCVNLLLETGTDCVGGALDSVGKGYVGTAIAAAMSSPFGIGGSGFRIAAADDEPRLTDSVPFPAYRRDVFNRVGLYNEVMVRHQDYEFNYRLRKAGGRILLLPSIRIKYFVRSSFRSLWRQYWQYGIWKGNFLRAHPASLKLRHLIPPVFVLMLAISALLTMVPQVSPWASGVLPAAYIAFILVGLVKISRDGKSRYIPILPLVFACLHFSYGLGIWLGLLKPKSSLRSDLISLEPENALNRISS